MNHISVMSYLGRSENARPVHKIILIGSDPYTHSELKFPDGISFSSEMGRGARYKQIRYSHPERWHEARIYLPDDVIARIRLRADLMCALQLEYDLSGAINSPYTGYQNKGKVFCSEAVGYAIAPDLIKVEEIKNFHPCRLQAIAARLARTHPDKAA
jgi:hypothetical protein